MDSDRYKSEEINESFISQFLDPGVSNGDVDWLFRGREVKKLTKHSNTINNEVQSQLLQAQHKALLQAKEKEKEKEKQKEREINSSSTNTSSISLQNLNDQSSSSDLMTNSNSTTSMNNIANNHSHSHSHNSSPLMIPLKQSDVPLKSSLKSSSMSSSSTATRGLKIDTSILTNNSPLNLNSPINDPKSSTFPTSSSVNSNHNSNINNINNNIQNTKLSSTPKESQSQSSSNPTSTVSTPVNRSRSSSLFSRQKVTSTPTDSKPVKKSLLSSLSSKLKGSNNVSNSILSPQPTSPVIKSPLVKPQTPVNRTSTPPQPPPPTKPSPTVTKPTTYPTQSISIPNEPINNHPNPTPDNELNNLIFKRVCFALDKLTEDPQQQIPSRRPKKGDVLIPEDMLAPPPKLSIGITNSFNEQTKDQKPNVDPKLYDDAVMRHKYFQQESMKHAKEAHIAAMRMANEVSSFKKRKNSLLKFGDSHNSSEDEDDEDDEDDGEFSKFGNNDDHLDIDTPLHEHVNYFGSHDNDESNENENENDDDDGNDNINTNTEISLETLYTRCCHLREILPIPATLKQLKNKSKPLHILKMLNPKPTLIDILSFSDFLAISPIITVIFDNVTIDSEMLKIVLISLKNSTHLEKLSLRNVPIDHEGWKNLCKFLETNKNIQKLDISQQRLKKSTDTSKSIIRSELNWDLLVDTLNKRGGIEELVINGCCLNVNQFNNLITKGLSLKTKRLGLASCQLDSEKLYLLSKWIASSKSTCIGVDLAFNDFSQGQLTKFNKALTKKGERMKLQFISLNSTNVHLNECTELIKNLSVLPSLRFLDLSNNPQLFPNILPTLRDYLPKFIDLRRIHLDFNELTESAVVQLCLIFQNCLKLVHVSLLGNVITSKSQLALYSAVKNSHIYNIDMNYDKLDDELVSRIAFYLMRNMELFLNSTNDNFDNLRKKNSNKNTNNDDNHSEKISRDEDLIFDGSLLTKAAEQLLENDENFNGEERNIIHHSLVEKTIKLRNEIQTVMNKLFSAREEGKLTTEGKENLLRFCLLEDSLENILDIFADEVNNDNNNNDSNNNSDVTNSNNDNNNNNNNNDSRPDMIRKLSSQLIKHHSTQNVLEGDPIIPNDDFYQNNDELVPNIASEEPHIVVEDANSVPVDSTTGKRVLIRNYSQTSIHSKKLEEEEGELHRWGFFVQQQNDIMPDDSQSRSEYNNSSSPIDDIIKREREAAAEEERIRVEEEKAKIALEEKLKLEKKTLKINPIPSGSELRETIMKAKGIESINDLIKKVNKDFTTVEKIYKHADAKRAISQETENVVDNKLTNNETVSSPISPISNKIVDQANISNLSLHGMNQGINDDYKVDDSLIDENPLSPTLSLNSFKDDEFTEQADEVYDRILNNVIRVRSNK